MERVDCRILILQKAQAVHNFNEAERLNFAQNACHTGQLSWFSWDNPRKFASHPGGFAQTPGECAFSDIQRFSTKVSFFVNFSQQSGAPRHVLVLVDMPRFVLRCVTVKRTRSTNPTGQVVSQSDFCSRGPRYDPHG